MYRVSPAKSPLRGIVHVPGDKSISHRAILFSALGRGTSLITGLSAGEDNRRTLDAFAAMGVGFAAREGQVAVEGVGLDGLAPPAGVIDCGNSGTTMRLLCGVLSGQPFSSELEGDASLRRRPMARVGVPLGKMGSNITGEPGKKPNEIYPRLKVTGRRPLAGLSYTLPTASAQVKSALLLAGLWADGKVELVEPGPSRDHTERMLAALGVNIARPSPGKIVMQPRDHSREHSGGWAGREFVVPGDFSSAAFLLVAALLVPGSQVTVRGVGVNPTRTGLLDILKKMGARIEVGEVKDATGEPVSEITAYASELVGTEVSGDVVVRAIDEIPILCIAAALAKGKTVISDAEELRVKESDRIAAMATELSRLGVDVEEREDGMVIHGQGNSGGHRLIGGVACQASLDHRIAMSCTIAGLCADGPIEVHDTANVATSFPEFPRLVNELGGCADVDTPTAIAKVAPLVEAIT